MPCPAENAMSLKIAVVTDIHHGQDAEAKKGSRALPLLKKFARFVAREKPDLVFDLGDRISDEDPETDIRLEEEVSEAFKPIRRVAPVFHICGNHDRDFLSVEQNEKILGQSLENLTLDFGAWRIALFRADTLIRRPGGFSCAQKDLDWLERTVADADRPLLIASHVPVSGHSQIGNHYFENNADSSTYPREAARIRALLRASRVPTAWISGHVHWNTLTTVDGIPHMTQQSLTESFVMNSETGQAKHAGPTVCSSCRSGKSCGASSVLTRCACASRSIRWHGAGIRHSRTSPPTRRIATAPTASRPFRPASKA